MYQIFNPFTAAALAASTLLLTTLSTPAQWSVRVDEGKTANEMFAVDDPRRSLPGYLFQPFTAKEWEASNFAPPADAARFQDLRYGMFIHFGLSTYKGQELSWGTVKSTKWPDGNAAPPGPIHDEYIQWPAQMRFEKFDAKEWVRIAKASGFRYLVAIAKHHEGFHLWDTAFSGFKITKTPFGRDYLKELADACHQADMPFGIYYAQREWYHPDYDPKNPTGERHQCYLEYNRNVCRELCTKYGKVDIFWFDAAWWGGMFTADMWQSESLTRMMRQLQPHMLINNRASIPGDFDTPEQRSGFYQDRPWEACLSLTESWSWTGTPAKSRDQLIHILASTACANGNALVSWGPRWNGAFDEKEVARLREVGDWLKQYGDSIYVTRGGPWLPAEWGGSTRKGKTVYLHVLKPELTTLELPPISSRVESATLLSTGAAITFEQNSRGLRLVLPTTGRDPADTVVALRLNRSPTETISSRLLPFNDPVAYGQIIFVQTNVPTSGQAAIFDLKTTRKVTGVVVEQAGGSLPLSLSLSEDNRNWFQAATDNGLQNLQLTGASGYSTGGGISQTIATTPGATYVVSIDVASRQNNSVTGNFQFGTQSHGLTASSRTFTTLTWQVVASGSSTVIDITGSTNSAAGQLIIDNIKIAKVASAAGNTNATLIHNSVQSGVDGAYHGVVTNTFATPATNSLAKLTASPNLLINGDFESPIMASFGNFAAGSTDLLGWAVDNSPPDGVSLGVAGLFAATNNRPNLWEVTVDNPTVGAILPGRMARYVRITTPGATPVLTLSRVQVHGF